MKVDPAGALHKLLSGYMDSMLWETRVGMPCKVIAFNEAASTADIQPIIKISSEAPALIHGVPVLFQRFKLNGGEPVEYKPYLKSGDIVFAVCSDRELKNAKSGQVTDPDTGRRHSVNDAVIVGVFGWSH